MAEDVTKAEPAAEGVSEEALRKAEDISRPRRARSTGCPALPARSSPTIAVAMSLFHLYAAMPAPGRSRFPIIPTQPLRYTHVAFVLVLSFLLFPMAARFRNRIRWWDVVAGIAGAAILIYAIEGGEDFTDRATTPTQLDVVLGVIFIVLLLEATRRTTGWIVPVVAIAFIAYAISGRICRRPGRTAASTSASSSAICSSRWKAFSAFRSTCRRR